jgi:hypothetical protein
MHTHLCIHRLHRNTTRFRAVRGTYRTVLQGAHGGAGAGARHTPEEPLLIGGQRVYQREMEGDGQDEADEEDAFRLVFDGVEGRWVVLHAFASPFVSQYHNGQVLDYFVFSMGN